MYRFSAKINKERCILDVCGDDLNKAREEAGWMFSRKFNVLLGDITGIREDNEKVLSIFNFKMGLHKARHLNSQWYHYIKPKRLTSVHNPPIYKWLFWWIAPRKSE